MIQHLVISGGGPAGFITYGAIKHLAKNGFWSLEHIKTIYSCSIGGYLGIVLALGYDWQWLDDYFIKRPWEKLASVSSLSLMEAFDHKGFVGEQFVVESLKPLFDAKDIAIDITLAEYYALNAIEIHVYSTNINHAQLEKVDISYKTHPDLSVVKALSMTMAYPLAFRPVCYDGGCYVDGGLMNNFPLNDCMTQTKCHKDDILAFKNVWINKHKPVTDESSVVDFFLLLIKKMALTISTENHQADESVKYTVRCIIEDLKAFPAWLEALSSEGLRSKLIERGVGQAELFLSYLQGGI